ncbi:MAG: ABC transporter permease [Blastocatellia bacterium]
MLRKLFHRLRSLPRRTKIEREMDAELRFHLEMETAENIRRGMSEEEARLAARCSFGGVEQTKEAYRDVSRFRWLEDLWQDVRFAVRSLRKHALLSAVVIATLTLGIGISAGVFTYFNADLMRARVDKDFDSFVKVYSAYAKDSAPPGRPGEATLEDYLAFRDRAKSLRNLAAYADFYAPLGKGDPVEARTLLATCNFFSLYDPGKPLMGRLLQPEDCSAANPVVVLGEQLWRNRFAADPAVVGKVVHLNGQPVTVVGVTKARFAGEVNNARAWLPYTLENYLKRGENSHASGEAAWLNVEGWLNPGFSRQEAAAELRMIAGQQDRLHPGRTTTLIVTDGSPIQDPHDRYGVTWAVTIILSALTMLVLIVCVNVTTLLLARASARRHEIAIRLALGAGRMRLVRMLLVETLLLASIAGLASFYLAYQLPGILVHWLTNQRSETAGISWSLAPDWRVFVYLTLITLLAGTMAGLTPALESLKINLSEMLKGRHSQKRVAGGGSRLHGLLIGAQVALSFFLLFGAGLCVRAYQKSVTLDPGFEMRQLLFTQMHSRNRNAGRRFWEAFHRRLAQRLEAMPGVEAVAFAGRPPFVPGSNRFDIRVPGQAMRKAAMNWVSPNFFATLRIPIVSGRALREGDPHCETGQCPVVVSQRLAREFWPDENPLGKTLLLPEGDSLEIVGIARDISTTKLGGLDDPMIYQPLNLDPYPSSAFVRFQAMERHSPAPSRPPFATWRPSFPSGNRRRSSPSGKS